MIIWEITISLLFLEATTLETRKSANHNGRSLFSCFSWRRRSPAKKQQENSDLPFKKSKKIVISRCDLVSRVVACQKKQENSDFPLQKSKKIVISRCDLVSRVVACQKKQENSDFPLQKSKKIVISRCDLQISPKKARK